MKKGFLEKVAILGFFAFSIFPSLVFADRVTPYTPGETLMPDDCGPLDGDAECTVAIIPDQTGNSGKLLVTDGTTLSWGSSIDGLTMSGDLAVNGGDITSTGTLTINSATTNALTLDSGTTGAVNIGTGANAKTVTIGNTTGASVLTLNSGTGAINIGTGAQARSINIGTGNAIQTITFGNGTPASTFSFSSGATSGVALTINTKSLTTGKALDIIAPSDSDLFEVGYDSNDPWDGARVGVGTSGKMDQLYVDGRINYSWNMIWEDFIEYSASLTTTDGKYNSMFYDVNSTDACSIRNAVAVGSTQTSSGSVAFFCQTTGGNNAWLGTNGAAITSPSLLPVMETRIQATSNTDHRVVVGFLDIANDASSLGSTDTQSSANEIMFRKVAGDTYWEGVTRSASGTEVVTEFTSYSTSAMRKLRIEVETTEVRFYIDDTLVGTHSTGIPSSTLGLGFYIGTAITGVTLRSNTIDYVRIWSDDPLPGQFNEEEMRASDVYLEEEVPLVSSVIDEVSRYLADFTAKVIKGVEAIYANFIKADRVETEKLCIGSTCITENELLQLLDKNNISPVENEEVVEDLASESVSNQENSDNEEVEPILENQDMDSEEVGPDVVDQDVEVSPEDLNSEASQADESKDERIESETIS